MLIIDQEKCVNCAICCEVCPSGLLRIGKNGLKLLMPEACAACGHCVAICPNEALDLDITPIINQVELKKFPVIDHQTAASFLRSRRSIRAYKKEKVSNEILLTLLDIARFAPTAGNSQGVSYIVYESPKVLQKIIEITVDWLDEQSQKGTVWGAYARVVSRFRKTGIDVILREAPNLIVAIAPGDLYWGRDNGHFSFAYLELYATSLGLGTCWAGFVEGCAQDNCQPMLDVLNIPKGKLVAGAVMVGYPRYSYKRLVDRNPLDVTWQ